MKWFAGWDSQIVETVLDIPIYFYDWGNEEANLMTLQPSDSYIDKVGKTGRNIFGQTPSDNFDQYLHRKKRKSTFIKDPLKGYHPDDLIDFREAWSK